MDMYVYRKRERKGLKGKLIQGKMQKYNIDRENNSKRVEIKIHANFFLYSCMTFTIIFEGFACRACDIELCWRIF